MTKAARSYVIFVGVLSLCVFGLLAAKLVLTARGWREFALLRDQGTVIRYPNGAAVSGLAQPDEGQPLNIAPYAKVTVSSIDPSNRATGGGVADGVVNAHEWMSRGRTAGAWIMLEWDKPAMVQEIDLYDRLSPEENVLGGTLVFDDGSMIAVGALPTDGTPARITFSPKVVSWVMFRIDEAQGRNSGLAEIMVFGMLNPEM